eukprot:c17592_g1_i4.p1 GENE.c17592_g1_i4~~c17592_g1_i4.p1  ORF type:complete len:157 (+),score=25.32 c17592_g1_i4:3-473(+)
MGRSSSKEMSVPHDEEMFEEVTQTGLDIFRKEAGQIRKGEHIVIRGCPCKVVEVTISKTGKHGHAKCAIIALDIFTGRKLETAATSTHRVEVPVVERSQLTLIHVTREGDATLMTDDGSIREDLSVAEVRLRFGFTKDTLVKRDCSHHFLRMPRRS